MKRHIQETGIKKWYGADILDLQAESLKVLDGFFGDYGEYIICGCSVTPNGPRYNITPGIVALKGNDTGGNSVHLAAPFAGETDVALPVYLSLEVLTHTRAYDNGQTKPIAFEYRAVASNVKPSAGSYITITENGAPRFKDAIQDSLHRFITDPERVAWNAKETPAGAQAKVNSALQTAQGYTDGQVNDAVQTLKSYADNQDGTILQAAKLYADGCETDAISMSKDYTDTVVSRAETELSQYADTKYAELKGDPPADLDTLQKIAAALNNDTDFAKGLLDALKAKEDKRPPITITNFDVFNPSANNVLSKLAEGESYPFYSYNATGRPPTTGATILSWSGTITRTHNSFYRIVAGSQSGEGTLSQMATRVYNAGTPSAWQTLTEDTYAYPNGYVKLPSGLMIQWGYVNSGNVYRNVIFPLAFKNLYSVTLACWALDARALYNSMLTRTSNDSFEFVGRGSNSGWTGDSYLNTYWIAIGAYK